MSLEIVRLLGIVTLQDAPILGRRRYGVPPGGPLDNESAALANALAGNPPGTAILELSNAVLSLRATADHILACVGAPIRIVIDGRQNPCQSSFGVRAGELIEVNAPKSGARAYLATSGGWRKGAVAVGQALVPTNTTVAGNQTARLDKPPRSLGAAPLRCLAGPQAKLFPEDALKALWTVSPAADRVGIRLSGPSIEVSGELPSEPACPGAVQVTNDGQLIILGPDGPTIGGYPKIAVVCSADLDRVGQLRPGESVGFEQISLDQARALFSESKRSLLSKAHQILYAQRHRAGPRG